MEVSSASAGLSGGSRPGRRAASMDFPDPGGPTMSRSRALDSIKFATRTHPTSQNAKQIPVCRNAQNKRTYRGAI